jgi:hypothetical protein
LQNEFYLRRTIKPSTRKAMKELQHSTSGGLTVQDPSKPNKSTKKIEAGFAKIIAGGRIVRPDPSKPELARMVMGETEMVNDVSLKSAHAKAVLESVTTNLEAGIELVDRQETALAKIGGKLSEIALILNQVKNPKTTDDFRVQYQCNFVESRDGIRTLSLETFDQTALFSNGPAKPITVAVPTLNSWEGVSIDRANLKQPGLQTVNSGKVFGSSPGFFLDAGSIKKAFIEWRSLCIHNRLQWGLLVDRLHGVNRSFEKFRKERNWRVPSFPSKSQLGPLKRPNRNN